MLCGTFGDSEPMRPRTFHLGSLSGNSWPMSGRLRAPSSASVMQCSSTSPSLCATQPRVCCGPRLCRCQTRDEGRQ